MKSSWQSMTRNTINCHRITLCLERCNLLCKLLRSWSMTLVWWYLAWLLLCTRIFMICSNMLSGWRDELQHYAGSAGAVCGRVTGAMLIIYRCKCVPVTALQLHCERPQDVKWDLNYELKVFLLHQSCFWLKSFSSAMVWWIRYDYERWWKL